MNITAFLQNPWFPPGTLDRHVYLYRDDQDFHRRLLANTMSGRRLIEAFGPLYELIHWDNTNWQPSWYAAGRVEPDLAHMQAVIIRTRPRMILCFGNQARDSVKELRGLMGVEVMSCPHPNARYQTQADLSAFAQQVRIKYEQICPDPVRAADKP